MLAVKKKRKNKLLRNQREAFAGDNTRVMWCEYIQFARKDLGNRHNKIEEGTGRGKTYEHSENTSLREFTNKERNTARRELRVQTWLSGGRPKVKGLKRPVTWEKFAYEDPKVSGGGCG